MRSFTIAAAAIVLSLSTTAEAETPRQILITAAFQARDKSAALALIERAIAMSEAVLAARPGNREASLQRGIAIGYRAKLTRSRTDAQASRRIFEALAAADPRDPEIQMVIAGWHLDAIDQLGAMVARAALGARQQVGEEALNRSVALGGHRAFFAGLAAMMRIRLDRHAVSQARRLAESAASAPAPTPLDQLMKRNAAAILPALKANDGKKAAALARRLLPFGGIEH